MPGLESWPTAAARCTGLSHAAALQIPDRLLGVANRNASNGLIRRRDARVGSIVEPDKGIDPMR